MPIFQTSRTPTSIRYVDFQRIPRQVVQVWWGDRLVWDGTRPALVTVPATRARLAALTAVIRAAAKAASAAPAAAGARMLTATPGGGYTLDAGAAARAGIRFPVAGVSAAALVAADTASASLVMFEAGVGTAVPGTVHAGVAVAIWRMQFAGVAVPATVAAPTASVSARMVAASVLIGARLSVAPAYAYARAVAAAVAAAARANAPSTARVAAAARLATIRATVKVAAATALVAARMPAPFVWTPPTLATFTDDFNRADNALGPNWNGGAMSVSSNQAALNTTTAGTYVSTWLTACTRPAQFVEATVVSSTTSPSGLVLRSASVAAPGVVLQWSGTGVLDLVTYTDASGGGATVRASAATGLTLTGKRLRLTATGTTYTGYVDGTQVIQWVDTGGVVATSGRYGGIMMRRVGTVNGGPIDDWAFGDWWTGPWLARAAAPAPAAGSARMLEATIKNTTGIPMGMTKSGSFSTSTSYKKMTGWTVRSGWEQTTVITNNGLALPAGTYTVRVELTNQASYYDYHTIQLRSGSTVVHTSAGISNTANNPAVFVIPALVVPGDTPLDLWHKCADTEQIAAAGTFITATPA